MTILNELQCELKYDYTLTEKGRGLADIFDDPEFSQGEWVHEPDFYFSGSTNEALYPKAIIRHPSLYHYCGYLLLPLGHPFHGINYNDIDIHCHGDLTYSGYILNPITVTSLLPFNVSVRLKKLLEPYSDYWAIGFDAAHFRDLSPGLIMIDKRMSTTGMNQNLLLDGKTYKNFNYMLAQINEIEIQISNLSRGE